MLRKLHLYGGWLFVLAFVLTGQYMRHVIHPQMEIDPVLRYSIRANHIYILMFGLLHLGLGGYVQMRANVRRRRFQWAGSALLITASLLTLAAFFLEPKAGPERPFLQPAMIVAVVGIGFHLLGVHTEAGEASWPPHLVESMKNGR